MLEADRLCNAQRYERSAARRDTRAGHYERDLQAKCFLVDTLGLLLHAIVHPADIQDRDGGYQGPEFQKALTRILPQLKTDIIKRSDQAKGFVVLPRRWIVEQSNEPSLGFNRCRRLAKDWENLNRKALALPVRRNCSLDPDARIALHPLHQQVER